MDFDEFLRATENQRLAELIFQNDWQLLENLKTKVIELLKTYYYVGGMPEAVLTYSINQNLQEVRSIQDSILQAYEQDFSKHAPPEIIPRIRMIWNGLVGQLSKENKKFVYGLIREGARAKDFEMAINWLSDYGLIHLVHRTKKANFPLAAYSDLQAFKIYALDVGLLAAMGNINSRTLIEKEQLFTEFKGALTEQFVLQEFKSEGMKQIYYWANDTGSAEVDFLLEFENKILPIEVKASENLQSKSLKTFSSKYPDIHCFRTSLSNFRNENWMTNIPLFGVKQLLNN
jgi:predicted AAA+ superfamily ATPase